MAVLRPSRGTARWRRKVALALAAVVLIAAAPAFFTPVAIDRAPALTLDICHPLQSIDSPAQVALAAAPAPWTAPAWAVRTPAPPRKHQLATRAGEAPATPPPKVAA